jgi:hypothetical protein
MVRSLWFFTLHATPKLSSTENNLAERIRPDQIVRLHNFNGSTYGDGDRAAKALSRRDIPKSTQAFFKIGTGETSIVREQPIRVALCVCEI